MKTPRTETAVLVAALRILERDIQSGDGVANAAIAEAADRLAELERDVAALKQRIIDDNRAHGCELRDPSGTIWDHAKRLQDENAALRADKERLEWLEDAPIERLVRITHLLITNDLDICKVSAAIDAAQKEAQP